MISVWDLVERVGVIDDVQMYGSFHVQRALGGPEAERAGGVDGALREHSCRSPGDGCTAAQADD